MAEFILTVNGAAHTVEADPETPLLYVLRNQLGLTGAKLGCGLEQCGACAILVDGEPKLSCVQAVRDFTNSQITTVEGLFAGGANQRMKEIFTEEGIAQCGYCTPGIVIAIKGLLLHNNAPDRSAVINALHGHLCRCGSHARILAAVGRYIAEGGRHDG